MEENDQITAVPKRQKKKHRHRKKQLYASILKQMEFYFSDASLSKDRFLNELMRRDPLVPLDIFLTFNKIKALTDNIADIAMALRDSSLLQVSEDYTKVKRVTPLVSYDTDSRTVYVESIPPSAGIDWLTEVFQVYGTVAYISLPKYHNTKRIKGFAFVEFVNAEDANACLEAFASNGCKLATDTRPDALYSYQGLQPDLSIVKSGGDRLEDNAFNLNKVETEDPPKKKIKRECSAHKSEIEDNSNPDNEKIEKPKETREETQKPEGLVCSLVREELAIHCDTDSKTIKTDDDEVPFENEWTVSETALENFKDREDKTVIKKSKPLRKRKKKDKKKPQKEREKGLEGAARGLQVLSKRDWKVLRNKYLNIQRKHMKELKQVLRMQHAVPHRSAPAPAPAPPAACPTYESSGSVPDVECEAALPTLTEIPFVEGVIVTAKLADPCTDVKKMKSATKTNIHVKFVDVKEGSFDVHIRLDNAEAAKQLAASGIFPEAKVLSGDAEKEYWEELRRQQTGRSSSKRMIRGRDRLVKKAQALAPCNLINPPGKHFRFDNND